MGEVVAEVRDQLIQASKAAGYCNEKLAEQLMYQNEFQSGFHKHFDDHKNAIRKQVDDYKGTIMTEIIRTSKFTTKVHEQNARLEQQRDQQSSSKSSSSGGCCMGFLRCFGTTPAKAPAVAVVPGFHSSSNAAVTTAL